MAPHNDQRSESPWVDFDVEGFEPLPKEEPKDKPHEEHPRRHSILPEQVPVPQEEDSVESLLGIPPYRALFCLKPSSWLRSSCARALRSPIYSILNLAAVTIVCANIAAQGEGPVWNALEIAVTIYFTLECMVKIIMLGLVMHPGSYLRSVWNILELIVTILGWLSLVSSFNNFTSLRTLRVLRTLKSISALKTVRLFTDAVLASVPMLLQCGVQLIFFFVLFGIVGTSVFSAALRFRAVDGLTGLVPPGVDVEAPNILCGDPLPPARRPEPGLVCVPWANPSWGYTNFDNILWVWLLLWQCLTMSQWTWFMYWSWDSMGAGSILYFWTVILFGSFAIVNLTLAVVNDTYVSLLEKDKEGVPEEEEEAKLRRREKQATTSLGRWLHRAHIAIWTASRDFSNWLDERAHRPLATTGPRGRVERLLRTLEYRFVVDASTWFGVILLACYYPDMPDANRVAMEWLNVVVVVFYAFDAILRLYARNPFRVFLHSMSDFIDVTVAIMGIIQVGINPPGSAAAARGCAPGHFLYPFRVFRLVRIVRYCRFESLRALAVDAIKSLKSMAGFIPTLFVYVLICSLFGMQLFGGMMPPDSRANFDSFYKGAVLTIFRLLTLDQWNDVMWAAMRGSNNMAAPLYFIIVQAIGNFIVLNGLVALLINSMFTDETREAVQQETMALKRRQTRLEAAASGLVSRSFKAARRLARTESFDDYDSRRRRASHVLTLASVADLAGDKEEARSQHRGAVFSHPLGVFGDPFMPSDEEEEGRRPVPAPASMTEMAELRPAAGAVPPLTTEFVLLEHGGRELLEVEGHGPPLSNSNSYRRFRARPSGGEDRLADRSEQAPLPTSSSGRPPPRGMIALGSSSSKPGSKLASEGGLSVTVLQWSNGGSEGGESGSSGGPQANGGGGSKGGPRVGPRRPSLPPAPLPLPAPPAPAAPEVLVTPARPKKPPPPALLELPSAASGPPPPGASPLSPMPPRTPDSEDEEESKARKRGISDRLRDKLGGVRVTAGYHKPLQAPAYQPLTAQKSFQDADWDPKSFEKVSLVSWRAGWSLFILSPMNKFRVGLQRIITHKYFERTILLIILGSCILLLLDYPAQPNMQNVRYADACFTCLFIIEAVMKITAMGFVVDRGAYLRDPWNWLDFAIVIASASSLGDVHNGPTSGGGGGQRATRVLRVFRALRPIRLIQRLRGIRVVITSILKALPYVSRVSLLVFIMWGFFATLGMQLFMGRMSFCSDIALDKKDCVGFATEQGGAPLQREWRSSWENFDNIGSAMMTLFEMATLENWVFFMYTAMDSTGVETAPQIEYNVAASVFFLAFIIFGVYAVMNWYISVVVMAFTQAQEELRVERDSSQTEGAPQMDIPDMTNDQKQWAEVLQLAMEKTIRPRIRKPQQPWRKALDRFVRHRWFEPALVFFILADAAVLMSNTADQSKKVDEGLTWTSFCLSVFFLCEALVKIGAFGFRNFFRDRWRCFDMFIVVVTTIGSVVDLVFFYTVDDNANQITAIRAIRVLRVARVFRLFSRTKSLILLFNTVADCLPRLAEVSATFGLIWFVFIIIGVQAFGTARHAGNIDTHVNFDNPGYAATILFSWITNERWNEIMWSIARPMPGDCPEGPAQCDFLATPVFFVFWMWFAQIIFINLVMAVMIDAFSMNVRERFYVVRKKDIRRYIMCWERYDPTASGLVDAQAHLVRLLRHLGKPLGLERETPRTGVAKFLSSLRIPLLHNQHVHYRILLHALIDRAYMLALVPLIPDIELNTRLTYTKRCPVLGAYMPPGNDTLHTAPTVAELFAALSLQARFRGMRDRARVQTIRHGSLSPAASAQPPVPRVNPDDYESDPDEEEHVVQGLINRTANHAKKASGGATVAGYFATNVPHTKPSQLYGLL